MKLGCYPHISVAAIHEEVCASIRCTHLFILFYSVLLMHIMRLRLPFFVNNRGAGQSVGLWLRYSLTAPAERPDCQYFCRHRNAMTNGTIVINEPVTTRFWIA